MGLFKSILHFIGGKPNGSFDESGKIQTQHSKQHWKLWEARFLNNSSYNWRSHSGANHTGLKKELAKKNQEAKSKSQNNSH